MAVSIDERLERLEQIAAETRRLVAQLAEGQRPTPTCLKYSDAAKRLGIGLTKLKRLIKNGELRTALVGKHRMVPLSEIERLSTPDEPTAPPRRPPKSSKKQKPNQDRRALETLVRGH